MDGRSLSSVMTSRLGFLQNGPYPPPPIRFNYIYRNLHWKNHKKVLNLFLKSWLQKSSEQFCGSPSFFYFFLVFLKTLGQFYTVSVLFFNSEVRHPGNFCKYAKAFVAELNEPPSQTVLYSLSVLNNVQYNTTTNV